LALGGVVCPADATNVFNGASITADGLTMSVTGCNEVVASGSITSCTTSNAIAQFVLGTGVRGADFSIEGAGTLGTPLFSSLAANKTDELTFTLAITAAAGVPVNFAELSAITTGTLASGGTLSVIEGAVGNPFSTAWAQPNLSLTSAGALTNTDPSKVTSVFDLNYDIKFAQGATAGTLQLTSVTSIFNPAPEPLSLSVFGIGLAGLAAARRSRPRNDRAD
jgi:hypothetical protein